MEISSITFYFLFYICQNSPINKAFIGMVKNEVGYITEAPPSLALLCNSFFLNARVFF